MAVTAYKTPNTCAGVDRDGKGDWADVNFAKLSDNDHAVCVVEKNTYGDWLRVTNFGFTALDIPAGSTIDGIEVKIEHKASTVDRISDSALYLRKTVGRVGDNKASATKWPMNDVEVTYGGAADDWNAGLNDDDIVGNSNFGVDLSALCGNELGVSAKVDVISIRVYYTAPAVDHRRGSFFKMF